MPAAAAALILTSCSGPVTPVLRGERAISASSAAAHVAYLASDALLGRNTPGPELDTAASYIMRQFRLAGLEPVNGAWYQDVPFQTVSLGDTNTLTLWISGRTVDCRIKDDFVPFEMTADTAVEADVVFAGYGITAPEYGYDDYRDLDVRGKIVLVLRHEPGEDDSASVFKGRKETEHGNIAAKVERARALGAVGLLVMTDPLNHTNLIPRGYPWPSLSRIIPRDALPLTLATARGERIPVVHVGERVITALFGSVDSLRSIQRSIDAHLRPASRPLTRVSAKVRTSTVVTIRTGRNVVGILPGADSTLGHTAVVVGAHYDHVGFRKNTPAGKDSIYNGADDNASGTAALIEVARAAGAAGIRPPRSILFIAFAGEEKGLLGSEYYARHPLIPMAATRAMLNLDMVGRNAPDTLSLIADQRHAELEAVARSVNARSGLVLVSSGLSGGGSDHMSFTKRNVPALFFHSGLHEDYHKVSDEASLIDAGKIARVSGLVFRTAWSLAGGPIQ